MNNKKKIQRASKRFDKIIKKMRKILNLPRGK